MNNKRKTKVFRTLYWHFCVNCGSRIVPFTKFEDRTVAPIKGKYGQERLLMSQNKNLSTRVGWCWNDKGWQSVTRVEEKDIVKMYQTRRGVTFRKKPTQVKV